MLLDQHNCPEDAQATQEAWDSFPPVELPTSHAMSSSVPAFMSCHHDGVIFWQCSYLWVISVPVRTPSSPHQSIVLVRFSTAVMKHTRTKSHMGWKGLLTILTSSFVLLFQIGSTIGELGESLQFVKVVVKLKLENPGLGVSMQFIPRRMKRRPLRCSSAGTLWRGMNWELNVGLHADHSNS